MLSLITVFALTMLPAIAMLAISFIVSAFERQPKSSIFAEESHFSAELVFD